LRCVVSTTVGVENKSYIFWVYVCSLTYPPCEAHALYYIIRRPRPDRIYNIIPRDVIKGWFSKKNIYWAQKLCFHFLYSFCLKYFLFLKERSEILWKMYIIENVYYRKCVLWKMYIVENVYCGKCVLWKMYIMENIYYGKCILWKMCIMGNVYWASCKSHYSCPTNEYWIFSTYLW
jgi:hypothetical protein